MLETIGMVIGKSLKFKKIVAASESDVCHTLFALDYDGNVWSYETMEVADGGIVDGWVQLSMIDLDSLDNDD